MVGLFVKRTPARRQIDPIECGAVCLGIILESYGRYVDSKTLRQASNVSRNGADAASLIEAAEQFGLTAKARRLTSSEVKRAAFPAIIFIDQFHFVVLEGVRSERFFINDPARGHYVLGAAEFNRRFSQVVIELKPKPDFSKDLTQPIDSLPAPRMAAKLKALALGLVNAGWIIFLASLLGTMQTLSPLVRQDSIYVFTVLIIASFAGLLAVFFAWHRLLAACTYASSQQTASQLFGSLANLAPSFFDDRPFLFLEQAITQVLADTPKRIYAALSHYLWLPLLILAIATLSLLAPLFAALVILALIIFFAFARHAHKHKEEANAEAVVSALSQAQTLLAMGQSELLVDELTTAASPRRVPSINSTHVLAVIIAAALLLSMNALSLPMFRSADFILLSFAVIIAALKIAQRPRVASEMIRSLKQEMHASAAVFTPIANQTTALVQIDDASFHYPGEKSDALQNISFTIERGEMLGLVGESQCGVSTLGKLIAGHCAATSGFVAFAFNAGKRARIALISEDADIMAGPLKEVLTLGDQTISDEAVVDALKRAQAHDLFYDRPMGLLAPIHEHGQNLSGSEKYRLLIAQALLHGADMLVLDDAFSAIETQTALKIVAGFRAHHLAAAFSSYEGALLEKADRVIFMHHHAIRGIDRHAHLYFNDESYRRLVKPSVIEDAP